MSLRIETGIFITIRPLTLDVSVGFSQMGNSRHRIASLDPLIYHRAYSIHDKTHSHQSVIVSSHDDGLSNGYSENFLMKSILQTDF